MFQKVNMFELGIGTPVGSPNNEHKKRNRFLPMDLEVNDLINTSLSHGSCFSPVLETTGRRDQELPSFNKKIRLFPNSTSAPLKENNNAIDMNKFPPTKQFEPACINPFSPKVQQKSFTMRKNFGRSDSYTGDTDVNTLDIIQGNSNGKNENEVPACINLFSPKIQQKTHTYRKNLGRSDSYTGDMDVQSLDNMQGNRNKNNLTFDSGNGGFDTSPFQKQGNYFLHNGLDYSDKLYDLKKKVKEPNVSRFDSDFEIIGSIGSGAFGSVYRCRSRMDGCDYAIKVSKRKIKGSGSRSNMLREVYALAALSDQATEGTFHIVRYYQAWVEESTLYIQTELCDGNLRQIMEKNGLSTDSCRFSFLRQILLALALLHDNSIVHLDIKPENIFIKGDQYKLGDFGLAKNVTQTQFIEEGDSRYMAEELLLEDHSNLTKCDIFSLGATMYEICLGCALPSEGEDWKKIRAGELSLMPYINKELQKITTKMLSPNPTIRPSAKVLLKLHNLMSPEQQELVTERKKNAIANSALQLQVEMNSSRELKGRTKLARRSTWTGW